MKSNFLVVGVVLLLCLVAPGLVMAQGHGPAQGGALKSYRIVFNDEQNKQLDVLLEKFRKDATPLRKAMMQTRQELQAMMRDASVPESALKDKVMKGAETAAQLVVKRAELVRAARKIATPDQLAKIDAYQARQNQERAKWMEKWEKFSQQQG